MRILIVCSGNLKKGSFSFEIDQAFIYEQMQAIRKMGYEIDVFFIAGKGPKEYLKNLAPLKSQIKRGNYEIIHAHFGLSGLISVLQRHRPVVVTFHGSDINHPKNNIISSVVSYLSKWRIFVSSKLYKKIFIKPKNRYSIIPCGIDSDVFHPIDKIEARRMLGLNKHEKYILFASSFSNKVKNYPLAKKAVDLLGRVHLLELRNRTRIEVNLLLNAVDLFLMTSFDEGSPQVIKEAMACNCPIVTTDVGDVKEILNNNKGCYITAYDPFDVKEKIGLALECRVRTDSRAKILSFDNNIIARNIIDIYHEVLKN